MVVVRGIRYDWLLEVLLSKKALITLNSFIDNVVSKS
jgi:hypothetical protein